MRALLLIALIALAGCGSREADPGGATPSEARMLNEAAEALDNDSVSVSAVDGNQVESK